MGRASDTRSEAMSWQELEEHCEALKADRDKWQKIAEDAIAQRDAAVIDTYDKVLRQIQCFRPKEPMSAIPLWQLMDEIQERRDSLSRANPEAQESSQ